MTPRNSHPAGGFLSGIPFKWFMTPGQQAKGERSGRGPIRGVLLQQRRPATRPERIVSGSRVVGRCGGVDCSGTRKGWGTSKERCLQRRHIYIYIYIHMLLLFWGAGGGAREGDFPRPRGSSKTGGFNMKCFAGWFDAQSPFLAEGLGTSRIGGG